MEESDQSCGMVRRICLSGRGNGIPGLGYQPGARIIPENILERTQLSRQALLHPLTRKKNDI
jgi:hypothetical protein